MPIINANISCPTKVDMKAISQAVILAGGLGTRLRPLTFTTPKPMILFWGKPFLQYIVELLKANGITQVVLLVGYLHQQVEDYFGDGKKFGIKIIYSQSPVEADTGTRIMYASSLFKEKFLLLYGDNYWPLQLATLTQFYKKMNTKAVVTIYHNADHATGNNMLVEDGRVKIYDRSRKHRNLNGVDIGFFILDRSILKNFPKQNFSFEEVVLPKLIAKKQLAGFLTEHKYYGLSTVERIPAIQEYFRQKKTIFLDRDGVINKRPPKAEYVTRWSEFVFLPRVKEALMLLTQKGYDLYIVTNQAGVARKKITRKQVDNVNSRFIAEAKKIGVAIADIAVCPHGWDEECFCRKPNPGLFFDLSYKHHINLFESVCIGDDPRDIQAGKQAGCKTILVGEIPAGEFDAQEKPDFICKNLYDAVNHL